LFFGEKILDNWLAIPHYIHIITFVIFGILLGSFANVVIFRLPEGKSVAFPASHCPKCKVNIKWYDNIPIISWILLAGKCRACSMAISWRYPLVELLMGVVFGALFYKVGYQWILIEYLYFAFGLVIVSFIDLDHMILPDTFTLSGIIIGLLGAMINPDRDFLPSALGVLFGGGILWGVAWLYWLFRKQEGMGGGDIKLLAWMGAVLSWSSIPFIMLLSSVIGGFVGGFVAMRSKDGLKSVIPFGPYLAFSGLIYILFGNEITHWYLNLFLFMPM